MPVKTSARRKTAAAKKNRPKSVLPTIGVQPEERELFNRAALAQRLTLSAWVRTTLWKAANEQLESGRVGRNAT